MSPQQVIAFWFDPANRRCWFRSTPALDKRIRELFEAVFDAALAGGLAAWEAAPKGALALVIVLDQLPLNMFRGQARSFAGESASRAVAERAIQAGFDRQLEPAEQAFLYVPFMHSEQLAEQDRAVELFASARLHDNLRWARHHREIIRRFGRFPHRNKILGRESSANEKAWLASAEAFLG